MAGGQGQRSLGDTAYRGEPCKGHVLVLVNAAWYGRYLGNQKHVPATDLSAFHVRYGNLVFRDFRIYGEATALSATIDATTSAHAIEGVTYQNMPKAVKVSIRGNVTGSEVK